MTRCISDTNSITEKSFFLNHGNTEKVFSKYHVGAYRYGFNGMEKDDEVKGNGNDYVTDYRHYDSRLGRWLNLDPMAFSFPDQSPYNAFANCPIFYCDPTGLSVGDPITKDAGGTYLEKFNQVTNNLPSSADNNQEITYTFTNTEKRYETVSATFTFNSEKGTWSGSMKMDVGAVIQYSGEFKGQGASIEGSVDNSPVNNFVNTTQEELKQDNTKNGVATESSNNVHHVGDEDVQAKSTVTADKSVKETIKDVAKTTDDINSGVGLGSSMVQVSARQTIYESMQDEKLARSAARGLKLKPTAPSRKWSKTGMGKVSKVAGGLAKASGFVDIGVQAINLYNTLTDPNASGWKKTGAAFKLAGSIGMTLLKANPVGFAISIGWSILTSWW